MVEDLNSTSKFIFYNGEDGNTNIQVIADAENETVWTTQKGMTEIFDVSKSTISEHIDNIFKTYELDEISVVRNFRTTASDGKSYNTNFYNLDMIIAIGYRVNSYQATQFRKWATKILKEYLVKGFALDDERLKQGNNLFNKNHFDELLERIREIRSSERMFYQKITDIYKDCSDDYDKNSPITHTFYATVQNKLHWAIHHHTAGEVIKLRADSSAPYMGLTNWKNAKKGGKILKSDVVIAKNYLTTEEIDALNRLVEMYLNFADNMARRGKIMKMKDWSQKLDEFLGFNEYDILTHAGTLTHDMAKSFAEKQYDKFRVVQDKEYKSDFDKVIDDIKIGKIPKEINAPKKEIKPLGDFDKIITKFIKTPPPPKVKKEKPPKKDKE